jgi:peroxiredoxin
LEALSKKYKDRDVQALVIDVLEDKKKTTAWAEGLKWSLPVLLDVDGKVSASYAPEGVLPDLPRNQVPIASNLIIDKDGKIQFYSLLDSMNFDAKLIALTARLEELLAAE